MTNPSMKLRRLCKVCGAVKMGRICLRCKSFGVAADDGGAAYQKALAKYQASRASKAFRPSVEAMDGGLARLRGQPGARHRRGGVPYNPSDISDDYGKSDRYDRP